MSTEKHADLSQAEDDPLRYERSLDTKNVDPYASDAIICAMIPLSSRVLDVGCGTGALTTLIKTMCAADIVGIEPNEARAEQARAKGVDVVTGYVTPELLASLGTFDVVVFADVLEHLTNPSDMLNMVQPYLRLNGLIVASMPNVAHWSIRFSLLFGRFDYQPTGLMDNTHLRWYTDASVKRLFIEAGFKVIGSKKSLGPGIARSYRDGLPRFFRSYIKIFGVKMFPNLFGFQHIVAAKVLY